MKNRSVAQRLLTLPLHRMVLPTMSFRKRPLLAVAVLAVVSLTACSSGSGSDDDPINDPAELPPVNTDGDPLGVFNPDATTDVFVCESRYYSDLRGLYSGEISYTSADETQTCTWDVTLQIRGADAGTGDTSVCNVSASYSYTLLEGDETCADGSLEADLDDPLAASSNRLVWENPDWPYVLPMLLQAGTPDGAIIPAGTIAADARDITWRADGNGATFFDSISLIDTNDADGTVIGTLIDR